MDKLLKEVVRKDDKKLMKLISKKIKQEYKEILVTKDYIICKGQSPIMLNAHVDTVHSIKPYQIFYDQKQQVAWSPQGLGADDRAGVYALLKIAENAKVKPWLLFTTGEEKGGVGAEAAVKELDIEVDMIIALDRKGKNDAVFYDCINIDFIEYIESFGFKEDIGSFSDISILCPGWQTVGVNLSIGYYQQHTKQEYLSIKSMNKTIAKVHEILENPPKEKFEYKERRLSIFQPHTSLNFYCYPLYNGEYIGFCELCQKEKSLKDYTDTCPNCGLYRDEVGTDVFECGECLQEFYSFEDSPINAVCTYCFEEAISTELYMVDSVTVVAYIKSKGGE